MSRAPPSLNARRSEIGGHQGKRGEADRVVGARFSASQVGSLDGTWVLELTFPGIRDFPPLKKKKPRRDRGALLYKMNPTTPVTALSRPKSVCQNQFARSERRRHGFSAPDGLRARHKLPIVPAFLFRSGGSSDPCRPAFLAVGRIAATALLLLAPFPMRHRSDMFLERNGQVNRPA